MINHKSHKLASIFNKVKNNDAVGTGIRDNVSNAACILPSIPTDIQLSRV